jgi:hypothetical protein
MGSVCRTTAKDAIFVQEGNKNQMVEASPGRIAMQSGRMSEKAIWPAVPAPWRLNGPPRQPCPQAPSHEPHAPAPHLAPESDATSRHMHSTIHIAQTAPFTPGPDTHSETYVISISPRFPSTSETPRPVAQTSHPDTPETPRTPEGNQYNQNHTQARRT